MGIETLQKAALAAGFVMATPDDDPPAELMFDEADDISQPAQGQWLVALPRTTARRASARDQMASAMTWIRDHLPLMGRAPA